MENSKFRPPSPLPGLSDRGVERTAPGALLSPAGIGSPWRPLVLPALLVAAAALSLSVDCPLARWCVDASCPRFLARLFGVAQPFGNGLGVVLIVAVIYTLDPLRRWALPRVIAMSLGAGLAADIGKMLIARVRPRDFDFTGTVHETFGQWVPLFGAGSGNQSFPSAHSATAVGLAIALAWLYPRGRWLFAALAVLVMCQRMEGGAHYLSDTLFGAAIGWLVAMACLTSASLAGRFARLERRSKSYRRWVMESLRPVPNGRLTVTASDEKDRGRAA